MAKPALGKGMGAIVSANKLDDVSRETSTLRISLIEPNSKQPRKAFEEEALKELADSIKKFGVLQPLLVAKSGRTYKLIAGERRWRAAKLAGLKEVPVVIKDLNDREAAEVALIENLQREDLNPVEEAMAYDSLIREFGLKQEDVAEKVSKSRSYVTNSLRLLKLEKDLLSLMAEGTLTAGHARALLSVADKASRKKLAERIVKEGLSVREAEKLSKAPEKKAAPAKKKKTDIYAADAAKTLSESLGTKVSIVPGKGGRGKIEIEYYSADGLNDLIERLK